MILLIQKLNADITRMEDRLENKNISVRERVRLKIMIRDAKDSLYNILP